MQCSPSPAIPTRPSPIYSQVQANRKFSNPITIAGNSKKDDYDCHSENSSYDELDTFSLDFTTSKSLPAPRAPYLHSKGFAKERLSKIPMMELPESAAPSLSTEATSYGSLRDSLFYFHDHQSCHVSHHQSLPTHMESGWVRLDQRTKNNLDSLPSSTAQDLSSENTDETSNSSPIAKCEGTSVQLLSSSLSTALQILESSRSKETPPLDISLTPASARLPHNKDCSIEEQLLSRSQDKISFDDAEKDDPDTFEAFELDM